MGEEVDDLVSSSSKMREQIMALSGVDILGDDGAYKSTYQILLEIAEVWDQISDASRAALLETLGGKRGIAVLQSIITNIDDLKGAYTDALNASGTAIEANEKYINSISGKLNILKATIEKLSTVIFDSEWFKAGISILTSVVKAVTTIAGLFDGVIPKAILLNTIVKGAFTIYGKFIKPLTAYVTEFGVQMTGVTKGFILMQQVVIPMIGKLLAMAAVIAIFSAITQKIKETHKTLEELSDEYEDQKNQLEELNNKLAENEERIEEINSQGGINLIDQSEIDDLEAANELLKEQIKNLEREKQLTNEKLLAKSEKNAGNILFGFNYFGQGGIENNVSNEDFFNNMLKNSEYYKDDLNTFEAELLELASTFQNLGVDPEDNAYYNSILNWIDEIEKALDYTGWLKDALDEVFKRDDLKDVIKELNNLDEVTAETFEKDRFKPFLDALDEAGIEYDDLNQVAELFNKTVAENTMSEAFLGIEDKINGATAALQKFEDVTNKDEQYAGYAEAYANVLEEVSAGRINSNEFWAGAEALFGADKLEEWNYDVDTIIEKLSSIEPLLADAEDSGKGFLNYLIDNADELNEQLGYTAFMFEDGGLNIDVQKEDFGELADLLNISTEALAAMFLAASNFGEIDFFDIDTVIESLRELGAISEDNVVYMDKFVEAMTTSGYSVNTKQLAEYKQHFQDIGLTIEETAPELNDSNKTLADLDNISLANITTSIETLSARVKTLADRLSTAYTKAKNLSTVSFATGYASGTEGAKPGMALTGEFGPEVVLDAKHGESAIVGLNGAEFYNFKGGEIVYNAAETARILDNTDKQKTFGSYASGTSGVVGRIVIEKKSNTSGSTGSSSRSSSSSSSSSTSNDSDLADLLSMESAAAIDEIEKRIDAIEEEKDALKDAADAAEDLADAEKEILDNESDIAKEAIDKRIDQIKEETDAATDAIKKQVEVLKEQLELIKDSNEAEDKALKMQQAIDAYEAAKKAKTARVYTADQGWIWTSDPEAVKSAKEALDELTKEYERDAQEQAINDQIDALEKQIDIIEENADIQVEALEKLSDAWDEQLDKMDYTTEEYQKYMDMLTMYTNMSVEDMTSTIAEFGDRVAEVMRLNSEAKAAEMESDTFEKAADAEIAKLKELKDTWSDYASNLKKTLEEYNQELELSAKFSVMSFDEMSTAVTEYMDKVMDLMRLNSQNSSSTKGYASGSLSIPSSGVSIINEAGEEMIVRRPNVGDYAWLQKGDGVIPANITQRLMALGTNPTAYLNAVLNGRTSSVGAVNGNTTNYNFGGDIVLNNVTDAHSFFTEFEQEINLRQSR